MLCFKNKVILITGSSCGVGAATAIKFAEAGAAGIVVNYRKNRDAAKAVAEIIEPKGTKALLAQADISYVAQVQSLVQRTLDVFGRLDVLVANVYCVKSTCINFGRVHFSENDCDFYSALESTMGN